MLHFHSLRFLFHLTYFICGILSYAGNSESYGSRLVVLILFLRKEMTSCRAEKELFAFLKAASTRCWQDRREAFGWNGCWLVRCFSPTRNSTIYMLLVFIYLSVYDEGVWTTKPAGVVSFAIFSRFLCSLRWIFAIGYGDRVVTSFFLRINTV